MHNDIFDLQLFAEDSANTDATADKVDVNPAEESDAQSEPIPPELEGLSEEAAREAMAEANAMNGNADAEDETADAGQDSDNKAADNGGVEQPKAKVPYMRFKEQVDKSNSLESRNRELEAKLAEYERRFGGGQPVQPQPQPQPQAAPMQQAAPEINLTPEIAQKIQDAVQQRALQMSGLSNDDVEALRYAEDNDPKLATWKYAQDFARQEIVGKIRQAYQDREKQAREFLAQHQQMEAEFMDYANKAMTEEDYPQIQEYAEKTFLKQFTPADQQVIGDAYRRIARHVGNNQDYYTIKNFYNAAKTAYRASNGKTAAKRQTAANMPRAGKVQGTSGGSGAVTAETLLDMAEKTPWEKIPPNYRDMLMGITPIE